MLNFDLNGNLIEPASLKKTIGGGIDRLTLPEFIDIPTTGTWSGVTVANYASDAFMAKTLSRTTTGKAVVQALDSFLVKGEQQAYNLRAFVIGGGSTSTTGATRRSFTYGFSHLNGNDGCYVEYRSPDEVEDGSGTFITSVKAGVKTRYPINLQINNPGERYALNFWLSRNAKTGGWTASVGERDQIRHIVDLDPSVTFSNIYLRPFVEWNWTYASGNFSVQACKFEYDLYWRF